MTHTNGQAKYKDLCFTFDDLQAAFCSGYTKGYNDSDSNEERTVSPIEGQLSVSEIVKRRKNLPATAPANGEEWEEKIGIKYFTTWGTLRRFAKAEDLLKDIRTLKLKWEEAERERIQAEKNTLSAVLLFMFYANQKTRSEIQEIIGKNLDNPHTKDIAEDLMMNIGVIQSPLHYSILKFANKYIDIQSKKINHKELERLLQESIASIAEGGGKE